MNAWDHLPNAQHIDWVLATVKQHPKIWATSRHATYNVDWTAARDAARYAAWIAAGAAAGDAAGEAAWRAVRSAARASVAARDTAWIAILALIAYDDCAHLLDMPSDRLKMWAALTEQPAAVLLLSAVIARELIAQLETV
jgi:hypothetical protein